MKRFESVHARAESSDDPRQVEDQFRGPWFNTDTAAAYLDFSTVAAFRKWASRHGIVRRYRGRCVLVAKADLDRAIGVSTQRKAS